MHNLTSDATKLKESHDYQNRPSVKSKTEENNGTKVTLDQ